MKLHPTPTTQSFVIPRNDSTCLAQWDNPGLQRKRAQKFRSFNRAEAIQIKFAVPEVPTSGLQNSAIDTNYAPTIKGECLLQQNNGGEPETHWDKQPILGGAHDHSGSLARPLAGEELLLHPIIHFNPLKPAPLPHAQGTSTTSSPAAADLSPALQPYSAKLSAEEPPEMEKYRINC